MKKRSIFLVLLGSILLTPIFSLQMSVSAHSDTVFVEDLFEDKEFAVAFHDSLINEFGEEFVYNQMTAWEQVEELHNSFPVNRVGETMFPRFYGGSYICDEGYLVTLTVGEELPNRPFIFLDNIEMVNYSYAELNQLLDLLAMRINNLSIEIPNLASARLDIRENRVVVELLTLNDHEIEMFLEYIIDHSAFYFVQAYDVPHLIGEGESESESLVDETPSPRNFSMPPGAALSLTLNGGSNRSVGYRARNRNGQLGFVTAAHHDTGFFNLGQRFYSGTPRRFVGEITQISRSHDAAFVRLPAGATLSNNAMNGLFISPVATNPVQGGAVTRISAGGSGSPLAVNGTILSTNVVVLSGGVAVQAVEVSGMRGSPGDSGGIVVHRTVNPTIGGIHIGTAWNGMFAYYVRADRINSALQLTTN